MQYRNTWIQPTLPMPRGSNVVLVPQGAGFRLETAPALGQANPWTRVTNLPVETMVNYKRWKVKRLGEKASHALF